MALPGGAPGGGASGPPWRRLTGQDGEVGAAHAVADAVDAETDVEAGVCGARRPDHQLVDVGAVLPRERPARVQHHKVLTVDRDGRVDRRRGQRAVDTLQPL